MKSILEEASSVMKAIEKGWVRAGKPAEFNVKILEHAEKNFFGLTTKQAKIGIFFDEPSISRESSAKRRPAPTTREVTRQPQQRRPETPRPSSTKKISLTPEKQLPHKQPMLTWEASLIDTAVSWLEKTVSIMGISASVTSTVNNEELVLHINASLINDYNRERVICKGLAHLVMEMLRNKLKQNLRPLRVIIVTQ